MPRSFEFSVESSVSVEQIHSAFSEENYWLARLAAFRGSGRLDSLSIGTDGSVRVVIIQDVLQDWLPGFLAKLYPRDLEVMQKETWSLIGGGLVRGEFSTTARGALGSGLGTVVLAPAQTDSQLNCTAMVEIKVPLVGGKIESYMCRHMVEATPAMLHFTGKWIAEHA
jgi:hypothetical protein